MARLRLLLDTHIWLWAVIEPSRLASRVTEAISSDENQLWLSPISVWEALLLHQKRRLDLGEDPFKLIGTATEQFREAPVTFDIARTAHQLSSANADPADRLIAATAQVLSLTLVTADRSLLELETIRTMPNR